MILKDYENYSFIGNELITKELYILSSIFGKDNKYFLNIQTKWFKDKDIYEFKDYIQDDFNNYEIENEETVRDSLSCMLRLTSLSDIIIDYEDLYNISYKYFKNSPKNQTLKLYDYSFKQLFDLIFVSFTSELDTIQVLTKYRVVINDVLNLIEKAQKETDFNNVVKMVYKINDLVSDLLDLLEDDEFGTNQFESENEVILYNFSIFYSTKFYFSLLLREKIITIEEKNNNISIQEYKPLIEEDELRMIETQMLSDDNKELYYQTLKN